MLFSLLALAAAAPVRAQTGSSTASATTPAIASPPPQVAPAVVKPAPSPPTFRLGDAATPLAYAARLAIDPGRTEFEGEIAIDLTVNRPLDVLWLNAYKLTIQSAQLESAGTTLPVDSVAGGENFIGFVASGPIPAGVAKLRIRYRGKFEALQSYGLFRQQDAGDWYIISQFEETHARRAFPCFDEPHWKTPWQLTLDVPRGNVAVSNTPQVSESSLENGVQRVVFAPTRQLPSYLVALAVGPFDVVDGGTAGRNKFALRYLAPRGRSAEMHYAKEVTPRIIELLEDYFGTPYPFEKLDSVSIPQTLNFGAMENAGMITYASRLLLAKPTDESAAFRRRYAGVAAHEIAHQWFGNLVTMKWWDDAWLNESFATWMAAKTVARFNPEWDDSYRRAQSRRMAVGQDRLASTRRVKNPVTAEGDIRAAFDSITYAKGGQVLEMFEQALGEEKFRDGVRRYLAKHARANATAEDFMAALAEASGPGSELAANFNGFITQPGVPLIHIGLDCKGKPMVRTVQQRLRPAGSRIEGDVRWTTPACFRYSVKGKLYSTCGNVSNGAMTLTLPDAGTCPEWVVANAGGMGYYVAQYDAELLAKLLRSATQIPAPDAVALVGDATLLFDSGLLPAGAALSVAEKFASNSSPAVKQTVVELLRGHRPGWIAGADQQRLARILKSQIVPQARTVGWLEKRGENDQVKSLRNLLLPLAADQGGDPALRKEAAQLSQRWLKRRDDIPSGIVDSVLNTAGAFADPALFDAFEKEAFAATDQNDRGRLLKALAHTRDPVLRARVHVLVLDERLNGREALGLINDAMEDDRNRPPAFNYLRKNYDAITARLPRDSQTAFMRTLGRSCTPAERDAFVEFFKDRSAKSLNGPRAFAQAAERIELCVAARAAPSLARGIARVSAPR